MGIWIHKKFVQKGFSPGILAKTFKNAFQVMDIEYKEDYKYEITKKIGKEGSENKRIDINEVGNIVEIGNNITKVGFGYNYPDYEQEIIDITGFDEYLNLSVLSTTAEKASEIINLFKVELELEEYIVEDKKENVINYLKNEIENINNRIINIEQTILDNKKLNAFISCRFDDISENYVNQLARFLELLGINVITGMGYEPRAISEKVLERLSNNIDILFYLIHSSGESIWTRDEMAVSIGKGSNIIPIVEKGIKIEQGILGNYEYIPFEKNHIGDSFLRILEAINYIKNK